jgi:hypothetical protein
LELGREDETGSRRLIGGKILRFDIDRNVEVVTPAFEIHKPIGAALRCPLHEG